MTRLGIRAQLLLVLTVFLALPWLGVEYARELERVLRDAQDRTLAGTAQAVAIALNDRPRLFEAPVRVETSMAPVASQLMRPNRARSPASSTLLVQTASGPPTPRTGWTTAGSLPSTTCCGPASTSAPTCRSSMSATRATR